MRRFYLPPADAVPGPGDAVELPPDESRHLVRVLRARRGDRLELTDGRGRVFAAVLAAADPRRAVARIEEVRADAAETAAPRLVLACGVVKGRRFERLLAQAVELGAHVVQPLLAARSEPDPGRGRRTRWEAAALGAMKQSGRAWLPEVAAPRAVADWLDGAVSSPGGARVFYGAARRRGETAGATLLSPAGLLAAAAAGDAGLFPPGADLAWAVGPEGGWDEAELARLAAAGRALRLGPHRLRTGTAAAAGLLLLAAGREALAAGKDLDGGGAPGA
jgi:16S rRNA (uracil1498-N3)-methyltransferase